jgi:hypothetical protein
MTNSGSGNIVISGTGDINLTNANSDINLSAGGDINVTGGGNINVSTAGGINVGTGSPKAGDITIDGYSVWSKESCTKLTNTWAGTSVSGFWHTDGVCGANRQAISCTASCCTGTAGCTSSINDSLTFHGRGCGVSCTASAVARTVTVQTICCDMP